MTLTDRFFVDCVKAGINGEKITEIPKGLELKTLYKASISHAVTPVVFYALTDVLDKMPKVFTDALRCSTERQIMREIQSSYDVEKVFSAFEKEGLKFMPLKGYHLKDLYPKREMRYTSDCDVLIDIKEIKRVRECVEKLGLCVNRYDEHHDIVYFPDTKTVFELHKMLFVGKLDEYFGVGFEKAKPKDGYKYFYELKKEDFYMTLIAHSAYHFAKGGGVGIRHLTDIYVFRKKYKLDEDYLDAEFSKCGLKTFKDGFEKLERFLFEGEVGDKFTEDLADYVLSSQVLGNENNLGASEIAANSANGAENSSKKRTFIKMIFPPVKSMKFYYPVLKKAVWLLPLFYVIRWFRVLFRTPSRLKRIKSVVSVKEEQVLAVKRIRDGLGINEL